MMKKNRLTKTHAVETSQHHTQLANMSFPRNSQVSQPRHPFKLFSLVLVYMYEKRNQHTGGGGAKQSTDTYARCAAGVKGWKRSRPIASRVSKASTPCSFKHVATYVSPPPGIGTSIKGFKKTRFRSGHAKHAGGGNTKERKIHGSGVWRCYSCRARPWWHDHRLEWGYFCITTTITTTTTTTVKIPYT